MHRCHPPPSSSPTVAFVIGQRWISETEPELGLGTVTAVEAHTVAITFPGTDERRRYSVENAPLKRVRFRVGDEVEDRRASRFKIVTVEERGGLFIYHGENVQLPEKDLSDLVSFDRPRQRLLQGHVGPNEHFELRLEALSHQHRIRKSSVRGFVGGRIALIPHQLYIAHEVTGRQAPRVLLADEVGLGKTIEACLILHRLMLNGRAARILILVPEPLVHQWFVELLRRFNLKASLFDEERCAAMELPNPDLNPFLDEQLIIASAGWLVGSSKRQAQALAAGWDMLVVDEAHHLAWTPEHASPEYELVDALARQISSVLLLTATPEQLGLAGHFARLRLLDPERYCDWEHFLAEATDYQQVAQVAERLLLGKTLSPAHRRAISLLFANENVDLTTRLDAIARGDVLARHQLIDDVLDRHGTGRVMFRNTRHTIAGFPERRAHLVPLSAEGPAAPITLASADVADAERTALPAPDLTDDPRIPWLAELVRGLGKEKVLLICASQTTVAAIDGALRRMVNLKTAMFTEDLTLLQRDRAAAWFAEDDGAQLLLCSEIGSEGRNFQFAHHLVLFDLPSNPELLEQRIGRLDRIGQTSTIHIHVPYVRATDQEILARWYHEGLHAFTYTVTGGEEIQSRFGPRLRELTTLRGEARTETLTALLKETRKFHGELAARLAAGRDRLLEMNSFRVPAATSLVGAIKETDNDSSLEQFLLRIFDLYSIRAEELSPRTYLLGAGDLVTDAFPSLPAEGMVVTCDRTKALARDDIGFLSWDHPIVMGAMDSLLGTEEGTTAYLRTSGSGPPGIFLEAVFVLECLAPPALHADRFLPPTPLRVVVDSSFRDVTAASQAGGVATTTRESGIHELLEQPEFAEELLPAMIETCQRLATTRTTALIAGSSAEMQRQLGHEAERLTALQVINRSIRPVEIELLREQVRQLGHHLSRARLRLDALRIIVNEPAAKRGETRR